jgi:hypothetical protein
MEYYIMSKNPRIGKKAVVIGEVPRHDVGDNAIVISPPKGGGVTKIDQGAIGHGAKADPGCIAIGTGAIAGRGSALSHLIGQLKANPEVQVNDALLRTIGLFEEELQKPTPEKSRLHYFWEAMEAAATTSGAVSLVQQIGAMLL